MNLFARGLGCLSSDYADKSTGMRGRIIVQTIFLAGERALVLGFAANTGGLTGAILVLVVFSLFVQAAEGFTCGIVPYVDPPSTRVIAGTVSTG